MNYVNLRKYNDFYVLRKYEHTDASHHKISKYEVLCFKETTYLLILRFQKFRRLKKVKIVFSYFVSSVSRKKISVGY